MEYIIKLEIRGLDEGPAGLIYTVTPEIWRTVDQYLRERYSQKFPAQEPEQEENAQEDE